MPSRCTWDQGGLSLQIQWSQKTLMLFSSGAEITFRLAAHVMSGALYFQACSVLTVLISHMQSDPHVLANFAEPTGLMQDISACCSVTMSHEREGRHEDVDMRCCIDLTGEDSDATVDYYADDDGASLKSDASDNSVVEPVFNIGCDNRLCTWDLPVPHVMIRLRRWPCVVCTMGDTRPRILRVSLPPYPRTDYGSIKAWTWHTNRAFLSQQVPFRLVV